MCANCSCIEPCEDCVVLPVELMAEEDAFLASMSEQEFEKFVDSL
jgi:hypothetical protein